MKLFVKTMIALLLIGFPGVLRAQTEDIIIKGTVTNKANSSETLMGVNIQELDVSSRVVGMSITDYNGQFVIRVKNASNKLVFTYLGFKKQTFEVGSRRVINVEMEEEALALSEAVVTGQRMHTDGSGFVIPEREISTAMQTINAKDFEGLQVGTLDEALQGRVAGLDIVSSSGNPGSGSSMRIRGTSSITGNKEPLIVLNGIPYEVNIQDFDFATSNEEDYAELLSINPDDIEQITVLKDAASTAIWGSKGANGVLMVTTKKGQAGPTLVQYTYRFTHAVQPKGIKMLNGDDYSMMIKQAYFNPRQDETAADIDEFKYSDTFVEYENFNNNTDWVKAVSQTGYTHDHYLNVSGG
ncbi:MAG: TonB-dependent receptor plug domain-containing protein, partial [Bacteroidales bacterium]|nr:TonB-dependent receptor plug domain-containing protein [Bacteroidales bacterium]